jgi:hypothetical protein
MTPKLATIMKPAELQPLVWAVGTVHQILAQPGENFYVFSIRESSGTVILRIGDAHTGAPIPAVNAGNPIFDLLKEAYFRKLTVEVGYRDFGSDPQSGMNKLCIDRVSLTQ